MSNVEFAASRAARVVELRREARQEKRRNAHESRIATLAGAVCALDSLIGETSADLAILDQRDIATFRDSIAQLRDLLASETRVSYR